MKCKKESEPIADKESEEDGIRFTDCLDDFLPLDEEGQKLIFFNCLSEIDRMGPSYEKDVSELEGLLGKDNAEEALYCLERGGEPEAMKPREAKLARIFYAIGLQEAFRAEYGLIASVMSKPSKLEQEVCEASNAMSLREITLKHLKKEYDKFMERRKKNAA